MNILEAIIVGIIFSAVGTFGMLQFKNQIKYEEKYSLIMFIIGFLFQVAMGNFDKSKWYCMNGIICSIDKDIHNDKQINNMKEEIYESGINEIIIDQEEKNESFIPSMNFKGKKNGYVYKKGNEGMGYYIDLM